MLRILSDSVMAATMLGQGKTAWQAEIDAHAELCDFLRFNCRYAAGNCRLHSEQHPYLFLNANRSRNLRAAASASFLASLESGRIPSSGNEQLPSCYSLQF